MNKFKRNLIFTVFLLVGTIVFFSCQKEQMELSPQENKTGLNSKLGKKLQNPYSVANMKKAYENLDNSLKSSLTIETTHYYVKFKPKNEEELNILKQDTTLELYDYPLDYEVIEGQDAYHDPSIPDTLPTYQYCAVPVDYSFPDVDYDILENLFIPEEIETLKSSDTFVDALVDEALRITGNLNQSKDNTLKRRRRKWRPAGTIKLWDDHYNTYRPLEGVVVRARRWFTTHPGTTDSSGYYSCNGEFRRDANYSINWERYNFEIRKSWLGTAKYDGPKQTGNWNLNIRYGNEEFFATIFKAAHHYYYKNIKGLRRPPLNSFWHTKLRIRAYYEQNSDVNGTHAPGKRFLGLGSAIKIYNPQRLSEDIYGTVIHEMAHASHWSMDKWHYNHCDDIVAESWARGVQWELTRMVYPNYQPWYCTSSCGSPYSNYTGVVEDMIDSVSGYDQVSGYTIRQIEDALINERYWNNWMLNIKNRYNNGTENNLESLFNYWN